MWWCAWCVLVFVMWRDVTAQLVNRAPHFVPRVGDMTGFSLAENTPLGTPVYQLKGIDPENDQLRYSISGQHLSVDASSGVVTLVRALDREETSQLEVIISITDEGRETSEPNTVSLRRVIPVRDVNDNPPLFHHRPYVIDIREDTPPGTQIQMNPKIVVTDRDEGVNAELRVTCSRDNGSDAEACDTFRLETVALSSNEYEVRVFVSRPLDYESRSAYVLRVEARDVSSSPLRAAASVAVAVRDHQDQPPAFLNAPYSATLPENTPPNTSVLEILAKDGDTADPRPVLLTIEGDTEGYFTLLPDKPLGRATLVTTGNPIDRESQVVLQNGGVYNFFIKATELINNEVPSDFTVTPITIIVTDVDDHAPRFNKEVFDISIPENIENGSPLPGLSIYVEDDDIGQNSKYDLTLRDVFNSEGVFAITSDHGEGRTPISIKVTDSARLDYDVDDERMRLFNFDIVTSLNDVELSSARVNIKLLDVNDNTPVFNNTTYRFNILENATIGSKVGEVYATDKDFGIFGEIEYTLSGFGSNAFNTSKRIGGLFVLQSLDYEKQKSYSLTLFAKDGGGKGSSTSLFIDVVDVNDNAPVFEAPDYTRTIRDGATHFEPQFVVRAVDVDGPSQGNGRIKYSITSDNSINNKGRVFTIDEDTGELSIVEKLDSMDTPRGQYELVIRATDYGIPPLHNETRVNIRVGVPGNQRPTFKGNYHLYKYTENTPDIDYTFDINPMNYKATIKEDAKPGDNVTKVTASDPDGLDDLLTYHIVYGAKDNFVINEKSGLISVSNDANLDRDVSPERYEIIVSAVDSGAPIPETATTTVFVLVQDVNDKPPKFNATESSTYISEKTKAGDVVTKMVAFDTDVNSKLKYSVMKPIKALSKAGVQLQPSSPYDYTNLFHINEDTGEIRVNGTLDYNQASIVLLTVRVVDVNAEVDKDKQFATIEHTIYIQPYADKNPQFTNMGWSTSRPLIHHKIQEEQPIGSTVLVLTAEDPVSGHLVSSFKVINSETDLLQVDPLTGQVVLTKHLDYEELTSPNLTLTVKATSSDGARHSEAKIIIEVININDNSPVFEKEVYKVSVLESVMHPELILTVKAVDADAVLTEEDKLNGYAEVRYALRGEDAELFTIDDVTGAIQVGANKHLDRERQSVVRVSVEASDSPRGGSTAPLRRRHSALLLVDVLDVDDNAPAFDKQLYTAVVPENVAVGVNVINMTATDPDEGLGGEIHYEFLDEGEAAGLLHIDPMSGVVQTAKPLTGRGRTAPYRLLVAATDGSGHDTHVSLALYIGDISANDGVPRFIRPAPNETIVVDENTSPGTVVYEVVATDPDDPTQPSGQLHYYIQQGDGDAPPAFTIERSSGVVTVSGALDRERRPLHRLVVVAEDAGRPPLRAAALLTLALRDTDDHKPHFARNLDDGPVVMSVREEGEVGSEVGRVRAVDEDIGENADIDYTITSGNELGLVRVERTDSNEARLVTAARIDREQLDSILITLRCHKLGAALDNTHRHYNRLDPSQLQVLIKVEDVDDHLPEFPSGAVSVGVRLNVAPHTTVTSLRALDADPAAAPPRYTLAAAAFHSPIKDKSLPNVTDVFSLDNVTGELKIVRNLIHYADGMFKLRVLGCNAGEGKEARCGEVTVQVSVVRERELVRLEGAGWSRRRLDALHAALDAALLPAHLTAQLHLHDHAAHTHLGPCFQLRSRESGAAVSVEATLETLRAMDAELRPVLEQYGVRNVTRCGAAPGPARSAAHTALLALAAALPLAALCTALTLCCMHRTATRRSRKGLVSVPPSRLYAEPLYSS